MVSCSSWKTDWIYRGACRSTIGRDSLEQLLIRASQNLFEKLFKLEMNGLLEESKQIESDL